MIDLTNFELFSHLPAKALEKINKASRYKEYASGTKIFIENETFNEIIVVIEGQLTALKYHNNKKRVLLNLDPGDIYGEVEVINGTKSLCSLIGYREFKLLYIPAALFMELMGSYEEFASSVRALHSRHSLLLTQNDSVGDKGKVICFYNVKGGAGKSVISANTAVMLAKYFNKKVALLDLNLAFGDQSIIMGIEDTKSIYNISKMLRPITIENIESQLVEHRSGLKVLLPPSMPEKAELVKPSLVLHVIEMLRESYDFIIVDTHNQLTETELTILECSDLIMLMMTMELTFINNTKKLLDLLFRLKIPREKVKVVLNRAFKTMGLQPSRVEKSLRYAISYFIPSEGNIVIPSVNNSDPFVMQKDAEKQAIFKAIKSICATLTGEEIVKEPRSMFSMLKDVLGIG